MARVAGTEDSGQIAQMLHEFNREFGEASPGVAFLTGRIAELIEADAKVFLLVDATVLPGDECGSGSDETGAPGFAQVDFRPTVWSQGPVATLEELYVKPDLRGRGYGEDLMRAVIQCAREAGSPWIEVVTGEGDTSARGIYSKFGFRNEIEGEENGSALYYELELEPPAGGSAV
jgi:GNAT superfamily N-acetyltransferase